MTLPIKIINLIREALAAASFKERVDRCTDIINGLDLAPSTKRNYIYLAKKLIVSLNNKEEDGDNFEIINRKNISATGVIAETYLKRSPDRISKKKESRKWHLVPDTTCQPTDRDGQKEVSENPTIKSADSIVENSEKVVIKYRHGSISQGIIMGIDVHKTDLWCCVLGSEGPIAIYENINTTSWKLPNNIPGINEIVGICRTFSVEMVGFESTGKYYYPLMKRLTKSGIECILINPLQLREVRGKKTDQHDAEKIAMAIRSGSVIPSLDPLENSDLKELTRNYMKSWNGHSSQLNKIRELCFIYGFDLKKWMPDSVSASPAFFSFLYCLLFGRDYKNLKLSRKITNDIAKRAGEDITLKDQMLRDAKLSLINEIESLKKEIPDETKFVLSMNVLRLGESFEFEHEMDKIIEEHCKTDEIFNEELTLICSIPGISPLLGSIILAEKSPLKYGNSAKYSKYCGTVPKVYQSGHKRNSMARKVVTGNVCKYSNKWLRTIFYLIANTVVNFTKDDNPFKHFYQSLRLRNKKFKVAIMAVAHKLCRTVYSILKYKTPYSNEPRSICFRKKKEIIVEKDGEKVKLNRRTYRTVLNIINLIGHEHSREIINKIINYTKTDYSECQILPIGIRCALIR